MQLSQYSVNLCGVPDISHRLTSKIVSHYIYFIALLQDFEESTVCTQVLLCCIVVIG